MEQFKEKFKEEAVDLIADLEKSSLDLSSDMENPEHIEVIFRSMHSLKGGSAMFGFEKIDAFTHQLETAYDLVRSGEMKVDDTLLDLTFKAIDHIKDLLDEDDNFSDATLKNHDILLQGIKDILSKDSGTPKQNTAAKEDKTPNKTTNDTGATYYIKFVPNEDIMKNGTNPLSIVDELASLGEHMVFAYTEKIPPLDKLDVLSCYTYWVVILHTEETEDSINEVFMFVDTECTLEVKFLGNTNLLNYSSIRDKLKSAYDNKDQLDLSTVEELVIIPKASEEVKESSSLSSNESAKKARDQNITSIRVPSEKLDELINLVSELVTRQASLTLKSEQINNKELITIAEDIEKITRRLRDNTFGIRLIPIDNMVTRFQRLVRELSHDLEKDIIFQTEGTDTELDKTIIEGLIDPLMHIIRNSIDHGIESPEERRSLGKPEKGKILLKAYYSGANVYLEVTDDGKGIDTKKIFRKAVENGLVTADADLSEKEILDLTFQPGFSTAQNVTKVSGRGVGMDVVKRKIADLRGDINIETKLNVGTTMSIKLPLTLSIIDGLLVKIDETFFVIPLATVDKCFEFKHTQLSNAVNNLIYINDGHIPFAYLRKEFEVRSTPPEIEQVIVVEYNESLFGLAVDEVVGEYQAVLTSLGNMFDMQDVISGATILGDGTVALVIDPNKVISEFKYQLDDSKAEISI